MIKEAKAQASRCPLALAEQCLLTLGSITHLSSRLQLWTFALDYDTLEKVRSPIFIYFIGRYFYPLSFTGKQGHNTST